MSETSNSGRIDQLNFKNLMEAAPDGILLVGKDGTIRVANEHCKTLFGYSPDELIGQKIEILVPDDMKHQHTGQRDSYFASPRTRPMGAGLELEAQHKDGTRIPVEISLSPFEFDGTPCTIAIVRDVSENRRIANELRRSNRELEQFAYVASHDLQEPLRMISGYTQLLSRRYRDKLDDSAQEFIDYAVDGAKRMQNLISDLLAYSRVTTKGKPFERVDLNDVVKQSLANLRSPIEENGAQVHVGDLPEVDVDRSQMGQVFQNLVSNGLKFQEEGVTPEVQIECKDLGDDYEISVTDNGIGLESQYAERIFTIFQRLNAREKYEGTGIGLAICKRIIERHGGEIHVASQPGEGSRFYFTLRKPRDQK